MAAEPEFCVCVLTYGDDEQCFKLAQRVFNTAMCGLADYPVEFRVGLNAVGPQTNDFVTNLANTKLGKHFHPIIVRSAANAFKYPMMREMFHARPLLAPITIWFDDDSCIKPDTDLDAWLGRISQQLQNVSMIGSVYKQKIAGDQKTWIEKQWWYNNKPVQPYVNFITGGWWAIQTSVLLRFDWPIRDLKHRGGDFMLGELCRQHDLKIGHFRDGVWINANEQGVESKSPRRGYDEEPIGVTFRG